MIRPREVYRDVSSLG